jgi:DEAD/DEAH box helicase domain-containing protein
MDGVVEMTITELLQEMQNDGDYREKIASLKYFPARAADYGVLDRPLPESLQRYLKGARLYTHQCQAINQVRQGKNVIITTPTASGKSLAFDIPVFEALGDDPKSTALFVYPTKALSNDQLKTINGIEDATQIRVRPEIYDGDTPTGKRPSIREKSRIIITNPFELHHILPWHYKWRSFFSNLQFVVIDEAHRYRGIFGSNIALLVRRLRRICHFYGSDPQFILCSATIANPLEFAQNLTGLPFELVDQDGSPKGSKYFVLYNPFYDGMGKLSTHQETRNLMLRFVEHGFQTLCFTVSRKMAEVEAAWVRSALSLSHPEIKVAAYRAGYLPEERRRLEKEIKQGYLKAVTTTNALELGIDIGDLDAVIISGYPGTIISTWQQAGRAGRRGSESAAVLVAFQNPLDQYFMFHPDVFFGKTYEHAIVSLGNPYILTGHLLCAAAELPVQPESDREYFTDDLDGFIKSFEQDMLLRDTPSGYVYSGTSNANDIVSLESFAPEGYKVICEGKVLETMERAYAFRDAHQGAVLMHQGETYLVQNLDLDTATVTVKKTEVDYYTQSMKHANVHILKEHRVKNINRVTLSLGQVQVDEQYVAYKLMKDDRVLSTAPLNLPQITFKTVALWFKVPTSMDKQLTARKLDFAGGLHGAEHALIGIMPFQVMCDRWDIGGLSIPYHPDTGAPTVFIYDGFEDGIGLTEKAYELFNEISAMAYELVRDCKCLDGCPGCIYSPKCGNDNKPLDKQATITILEELQAGN